ncbi:MAG: DUF2240 family protein [Methanocella sp.]
MDELKIVIAQPFKIRGKARLAPAEFTFALTLELKWLTPEESRQVIDEGLKAGLLREEKGKIAPAFDYRNVIIPPGFRPGFDIFKKKSLLERIVDLLTNSGMSEAEAQDLIKHKVVHLIGCVTPEVAGLIVAKERGLDVMPYIDEAFAELVKK